MKRKGKLKLNSQSEEQQTDQMREFVIFIGQRLQQHRQSFECDCDLSRHEFTLLFLLGLKGPLAVKEIARHMQDVSLSTLTRLMDNLEHKHYIERNLDPNDRRSFVITPTERGKALLQGFPQHLNKLVQGMLQALIPEERLILLELFTKIRLHMEHENS